MAPSSRHTAQLLSHLHAWYEECRRPLPWRDTRDAYRIWLSEVILQQTRVDQGTAYYHRFVDAYPTVQALSEAPLDEILKLWEGLGYYSRARHLHQAAQIVVADYGGELPRDFRSIRRLPGIGAYTAGAILSFAYNLAYPAVDGNVLRVLSRLYANDMPIDTTEGKHFYERLATDLVQAAPSPGMHNQAMIELGALVCTPGLCPCDRCPISSFCPMAHDAQRASLPRKALKVAIQPRHLGFLFLLRRDAQGQYETALFRRSTGDIWANLYQPYLIFDLGETPSAPLLQREIPLLPPSLEGLQDKVYPLASYKHRLTHRQLFIDCYYTEVSGSLSLELSGATWVPLHDDNHWRALPIILKKAMLSLQDRCR